MTDASAPAPTAEEVERELVSALRVLSSLFDRSMGSKGPDYGEVTGPQFQMMTDYPDPVEIAAKLPAIGVAADTIESLRTALTKAEHAADKARAAGKREGLEAAREALRVSCAQAPSAISGVWDALNAIDALLAELPGTEEDADHAR